jgi:hypothetical protein
MLCLNGALDRGGGTMFSSALVRRCVLVGISSAYHISF